MKNPPVFTPGESVYVFKFGALGDVVRTSYIINALVQTRGVVATWVTTKASFDLLRFNPYIQNIIDERLFEPSNCDHVLSLDDEFDSVSKAYSMNTKSYFGTYINTNRIDYTSNSALWNDMGLLSRFGKEEADILKRTNKNGHSDIFRKMLGISSAPPTFFGNPVVQEYYAAKFISHDYVVGFNPYAGKRWPSKEIIDSESISFLKMLVTYLKCKFKNPLVVVVADESTSQRAKSTFIRLNSVTIENTSKSVLHFAALVKSCDLFVTVDSLGMHLAISQKIPTISIFTATSASEIDDSDRLTKIVSTSSDYCSYSPTADNSSITADRLFAATINIV